MSTTPRVKFESTLEVTDGTSVWHILRVLKDLAATFQFKGNLRRVLCSLNGSTAYNCSLFPSKGGYVLTLSKQLRQKLALSVGDIVNVELWRDESKYGMPMPEEFAEVLRQDPEGDRLFNALSPGDQRLMLKLIVFVKDPDRRIARALTGIELLKRSGGKFVYSEQHLAMKIVTSAGRGVKFVP